MLSKKHIVSAQCRAARGLVQLDQAALAQRAVVSRNVIVDFESGKRTPTANNLLAIAKVLEEAGVIFVEENGEGPGVRLGKSKRAAADPKHSGPATDVVDMMDKAIETHRDSIKVEDLNSSNDE